MAGLKFQAERAAFSLAADKVLKYMNKTDDRTKALLKLVDLTENLQKIVSSQGLMKLQER